MRDQRKKANYLKATAEKCCKDEHNRSDTSCLRDILNERTFDTEQLGFCCCLKSEIMYLQQDLLVCHDVKHASSESSVKTSDQETEQVTNFL